MDIFTPALIFDSMSGSNYVLAGYLLLSLGCIAVVLGSGIIAWPVARMMGYQWKTLVPPMMFNNSGNMGLPLVVLTFGEAMLPAAILNFIVAERFSQESHRVASIVLVGNLASVLVIPTLLWFIL